VVDEEAMDVPRLREVLRSFDGESWVLVDEAGQVTYGFGRAVTGRGAREGTHIAEFVHPDDLPRVMDAMAKVVAQPGTTLVERVRIIHGDGTWRAVECTAVNRLDDPLVRAIVVRTVEVRDESPPALDDIIGSLAEAVPTPLLVVDDSGFVLFSNSAARVLLGEHVESVMATLGAARDEGSTRLTFELGDRWIHARIAPQSRGWIALLDDITAQRDNEEHLMRLAMTDPLTGASNRASFDARLSQLFAAQRDKPISLIFVDLDGFKGVNDRHGHAAGDHVLKVVAARLKGELRPGDTVARLGGDEFGIICPGLTADYAPTLAERLVSTVHEPITVGAVRILVGASAGIATSPPAPADPAALLAAADAAMYREKSEVEVWQPLMEL
jgi:diguanylate cyclase (GGDEF)-like protein